MACGIATEDLMFVTGGRDTLNVVVGIDSANNGFLLPNLNTGREGHSCGYYANDNDEMVIFNINQYSNK